MGELGILRRQRVRRTDGRRERRWGGANALRWDPPQDLSSPTFSGETEICIALGLSGFVETSEEVGGFGWVNLK